ncbi:MAG: hypothetical protein HYY60_00065, partial [Parcubacteria group bacterium]|nr:hypothetical protein [Parcubacteria group bacterium]
CVQHLRRFLIAVYRKGLFDIIKKTDYAPMSGVFGSTELSSNRVEGGMFIRFRSWQSESLGEVIFSGAIEDPSGNSFGIHTITTEQHGVDALVQEVVSYWPEDPVAQMSMFRISANTRKLN